MYLILDSENVCVSHTQELPQEQSPGLKYLELPEIHNDLAAFFISFDFSLVNSIDEAFILEALKVRLNDFNASLFSNTLNKIVNCPFFEISTFSFQEQEAKNIIEGLSSPYLEVLAASRGDEVLTLANKILNKAQEFKKLSIKMLGVKQKLEAEIKKIKTSHKAKNFYKTIQNAYLTQ